MLRFTICFLFLILISAISCSEHNNHSVDLSQNDCDSYELTDESDDQIKADVSNETEDNSETDYDLEADDDAETNEYTETDENAETDEDLERDEDSETNEYKDIDFEADTDNEISDDTYYADFAENLSLSAGKGIEFLLGKQKINGAIRDDNYEIFDVWETVNALLGFSLWKTKISSEAINTAFENGIEFLKTSESLEGLVLHTHNNDGDFCVETSSEYLRLLLIIQDQLSPINNLDERIDFLRDMQNDDGSFNVHSEEILPENQNYPSVTGFALRMLKKAGKTANYHKEAFDFFCNEQKEDNTWGFNWQFYGTPFYAFDPILSVWDRTDEEHLNCMEKSILYLRASLKESGEYDDNVLNEGSSISAELKTALASYAMWNISDDIEKEDVLVSVSWLLSRQKIDGSWHGGLFPNPNISVSKNEDIYTTSVILNLFSEVHDWLLINSVHESEKI